MTDDKLSELEAACNAAKDSDGNVRLSAGDLLELVNELRALRKHTADLRAHQGAIANLHQILCKLCADGESAPIVALTAEGRIAVQDPGR
jgi:hypothetical protein